MIEVLLLLIPLAGWGCRNELQCLFLLCFHTFFIFFVFAVSV